MRTTNMAACGSSRAGAEAALPEAAGVAAAADGVGGREAAEAEGARGEPGGQAEEDPRHAGPGGLQQGHQRKPVYVPDADPSSEAGPGAQR